MEIAKFDLKQELDSEKCQFQVNCPKNAKNVQRQ